MWANIARDPKTKRLRMHSIGRTMPEKRRSHTAYARKVAMLKTAVTYAEVQQQFQRTLPPRLCHKIVIGFLMLATNPARRQ